VVKRGSGRTKTEAKRKLKSVLRDHEDGLTIAPSDYTVAHAVNDWLAFGLAGRDVATLKAVHSLCRTHVLPSLGARRIRDLSADDVDKWLAGKVGSCSTRTLQGLRSCLNRAIKRAMARDKVKRNVVSLCGIPRGRLGRPSKALTFAQAEAVLVASAGSRMDAYILLSLLTGARTEELRALKWDHLDLVGTPELVPFVPPYMEVWRSVRRGGDTKTRKSRSTLALPQRCVDVLKAHHADQARDRTVAGERWQEHGLVFASRVGTPLDPSHVRRGLPSRYCWRCGRGRPGVDPTGAAAQLRLPLVRQRRAARGDLPAGRSQQHSGDRARVPQADPASDAGGCDGDGPDLS